MNSIKGVAIVLIAAGALALAVGGFSYTRETHEAHIGSLDLSVKDKERVNLPVWAGVGAIVIGAGLLLAPVRKSCREFTYHTGAPHAHCTLGGRDDRYRVARSSGAGAGAGESHRALRHASGA